jgi:D-serine deaminase-like pyridoxal phosphate-dependent protein
MNVADLPTPALVLDLDRMLANIDRMADRAERLGVRLRPHVKTPKSVPVAEALLARAARGVTVSTLREAEHFAEHGITDLLLAAALIPARVERATALRARGVDLTTVVDSAAGAAALAAATEGLPRPIPVLIELDVDGYRSGVERGELDGVVDAVLAAPGLEFRGLLTYAGASYHTPREGRAALAELHRAALVGAADALERRGIPCPVRSFGSTPAFLEAATMQGVTEVRGGIYVFQDLFQAGIGACRIEDVALTVATAVVSIQPSAGRFFVDAGGLALSKDRSTAGTDFDAGFGLVAAADGTLLDDLWVRNVHQELGEVATRSGRPLEARDFPIGRVLRILPNHADMTAAAYETYHVARGATVVAVWERRNGW